MKFALAFGLLSSIAATKVVAFMPVDYVKSLVFGWDEHNVDILFSAPTKGSARKCRDDESAWAKDEKETIYDRLRRDDRFSKLVDVLEKHRGLRDDLDSRGERMTFFAPTNEAFDHAEKEIFNLMMKGRKRPGNGDRDKTPPDSMTDIIRYHMSSDVIRSGDLYDGKLIVTEYMPAELNRKHQRIRVFKLQDQTYLNMYARIDEADIETQNGVIHAVNRVLRPPPNTWDTLYMLPSEFSTLIAAVERANMTDAYEKGKGVTVFAPNNMAWEQLGLRNLLYLFSQEGNKDLRKVLEYQISNTLFYSSDALDKEGQDIEIPTLIKNESIKLVARRREGTEFKRFNRLPRLHRNYVHAFDDEGKKPSDYTFDLNDGKANIKVR
ncbi:hypothetical protein HK102_003601 [Quaeritorhiza haematococci]|nr:hypothetical protein HK102_003601 [Quaeritorhiza haematococci]